MKRLLLAAAVLTIIIVAGLALLRNKPNSSNGTSLRVGMAPYQDLAMIVNAHPLGLEARYGTNLDLVTMAWEDIPSAVASAGRAVDIGFGSYIEYLTKYPKLNAGSSDPVLFIYPLYAFKGGAFVTFNPEVPALGRSAVEDASSPTVKSFFDFKIGAQKASVYDMMLHQLAATHGVPLKSLRIIDTPLDQGFLAAQQGSLDIATAGLTQLTETNRRGGRTVLTMADMRFADLTGFIVKKSVWDHRRKDVENLIRMWFDSVDYVYTDIDRNSAASLAYLNKNASTRYTLAEYKSALDQEFLPRSVTAAEQAFVKLDGQFPAPTIGAAANRYLMEQGVIRQPTPIPQFPTLSAPAH